MNCSLVSTEIERAVSTMGTLDLVAPKLDRLPVTVMVSISALGSTGLAPDSWLRTWAGNRATRRIAVKPLNAQGRA
jgi:hypothetical protein